MAQNRVTIRTYVVVLLALLALLVLTVVASFIDFDQWAAKAHLGAGWSVGIALAIATAKALLIALFFMHLKYASRLTWAFAGAAFVWLGIMLTLTLGDYLTRNHPPDANFRGEPRFLETLQARR